MKEYYSHKSVDDRMQTAADHAHGTAELAEGFAGAFGFAAEGSAAGLHHDDGKYAPKFQARLNGASETYEHSSAGMYLFEKRSEAPGRQTFKFTWLLLAHAVGGHHSLLADRRRFSRHRALHVGRKNRTGFRRSDGAAFGALRPAYGKIRGQGRKAEREPSEYPRELPTGLLRPCLRAISELVKNYGCTSVLCTATQPALEGLLSNNRIIAREICPDTAGIYEEGRAAAPRMGFAAAKLCRLPALRAAA